MCPWFCAVQAYLASALGDLVPYSSIGLRAAGGGDSSFIKVRREAG